MWLHEESLKCGGCGEFLDESTAPAVPNQWAAEVVVCNGCAAREMEATKERPGSKGLPPGAKLRTVNRGSD